MTCVGIAALPSPAVSGTMGWSICTVMRRRIKQTADEAGSM
jgi:hypothetical protein